jgi:membrane-bound lytic murein transglycosylase A
MAEGLAAFRNLIATNPTPQGLNQYVRDHFEVYRAAGSAEDGQVLFTGYYEPLLEGHTVQDGVYKFPIYGRPTDLAILDLSPFGEKYKGVRLTGRYTSPDFVPYHDRRAIDLSGVLADKAQVLAWVKDPVDLFFLHIQGSGKVTIPNQSPLRVHYAAANGRPYRSIGRLLIDTGKIPREEMSMQSIRAYLKAHPEEMDDILHYNPSYVFFQLETEGPLGAINVVLTPGRSLALDRKLFPLAGLAFARIPIPLVSGDGTIAQWMPASRFVLPQDTGGAIKGAGRADLFWGDGEYAALAAGHMQHKGELFLLAPVR